MANDMLTHMLYYRMSATNNNKLSQYNIDYEGAFWWAKKCPALPTNSIIEHTWIIYGTLPSSKQTIIILSLALANTDELLETVGHFIAKCL